MLNDLCRDIIYCVYCDLIPVISDISINEDKTNIKIVIDFHEKIDYGNGYTAVYVGLKPFEVNLNISKDSVYRIINNLFLSI